MNVKAPELNTIDSQTRLRQIEGLCPARHDIYKFLAAATAQAPNESMIAALLDHDLSPALLALSSDPAELVARGQATVAAETEAAREDFDALFLVPTSRYLEPFESVYAEPGRKGLLMGAPAWSALRFYERAGAAPVRRGGLLPDHIAVELAFMEFLTSEEKDAWQEKSQERATEALSTEARFLTSHLGRWVPELGDFMERNANGSFYKGISRLLRATVARDLATLAFLAPKLG